MFKLNQIEYRSENYGIYSVFENSVRAQKVRQKKKSLFVTTYLFVPREALFMGMQNYYKINFVFHQNSYMEVSCFRAII